MSKNKNKLVPKLRFPEFVNSGEWEVKELKNVSEVVMGSSPSSSSYNENKVGLPLIQGNADIKNRKSVPRIYTFEVTKVCQIGDILLSVRAPVGTVAKSLHKACIGRGIAAIRAIDKNSQEFLYQWLISNESSWQNISQGGTFDAVNSDDVRNLLLPIPKLPEQKKIASCLSSLDELIEAESQKLELYQQHKKGLMQNLFPQTITNYELGITNEEIEKNNYELKITNEELRNNDEEEKFVIRKSQFRNLPKLRFPEFQDAEEWEVKRLSELLDYERPDKYIVSSENYNDSGIPVLTANKSFILGYTNESEGVCENLPAIIFDDFTTDKKYVDFPFKVKSSAIKILRTKEKDDLKFLFELMSLIRLEAKEHKRYYISVYQNLSVPVPSPKEQQKIASCLSSLDDLINAQRQKIESLKQHKKGLLQGLFPELNF